MVKLLELPLRYELHAQKIDIPKGARLIGVYGKSGGWGCMVFAQPIPVPNERETVDVRTLMSGAELDDTQTDVIGAFEYGNRIVLVTMPVAPQPAAAAQKRIRKESAEAA